MRAPSALLPALLAVPAAAQEPVAVTVHRALDHLPVHAVVEARPVQQVVLRSRVDGQVGRLMVTLGQQVKGLDELLFLSTPHLQARVGTLQTAMSLAEDRFELARLRREEAELAVERAGLDLEAERRRAGPAFARLAAAERERQRHDAREGGGERASSLDAAVHRARRRAEDARRAVTRAEKEAEAARVAHRRADREVVAARTAVNVARGRMLEQKLRLDSAMVKAPFGPAVVTELRVGRGDLVRAFETPLLELADLSQLVLGVPVPAAFAPYAKTGAQGKARWPGGREVDVRIEALAGVVDPETRAMTARIVVPDPRRELLAGVRVAVTLELDPDAACVVPARALVRSGDGVSVFTVADGRARRVAVDARPEPTDSWAVIEDGLRPGTRIVIPVVGLEDGTPIEVRDPREG